MKYSMILAAAALAASAAATPITPGTPITTPPPVLLALGGPVTAVYIFADAGHTDSLGLTTSPANNLVFCNHPSGTCGGNASGDTKGLGPFGPPVPTPLQFSLTDHTSGHFYLSNMPDAGGTNYHTFISTNINDFGLTPAQLLAAAPGIAAASALPNVTFVGWEDKMIGDPNPDWDYNDLIFAFSATRPNNQTPEPLTLSLMGAGLLGAFGLRRVKKS